MNDGGGGLEIIGTDLDQLRRAVTDLTRQIARIADVLDTPEAKAALKAIANPVIVMKPPRLEDLP